MPPKNVCKRKTKTSTSRDNVEHSDREAGETGHESDEGERDAQEEGDREKSSCSFSTATEERLVEILQQTQRLTTRHNQISIDGSYIHVYIYRNKRTFPLRTRTYT